MGLTISEVGSLVTENMRIPGNTISVVLPAKNEAASLRTLLPALRKQLPDSEIIVVNDASTDETPDVCVEHGVKVISHRYSIGNGGAIKAGAREAKGEILVFMDADGQHSVGDIPRLLAELDLGYDMIVGARTATSQASVGRRLANKVYNTVASWMVGHTIADLTSGFRAARASKFKEFLYLLPNGFSYPTTVTMAFFRAGYTVGYVPINAGIRMGKSHIKATKDSVKFFIIIFRVGTLYSPLKLFVPASMAFFLLALGYYGYTFVTESRFTNMSALLFTASALTFLIGLVSEQITSLLYSKRDH